jgi:hypothetical protein
VVGEGYILVGDAACFVDPLFSSGVHLALMSGVLAAAYVTSAFKDRALAEAAKAVYQDLYYQEYHHFRELAQLFYSSNRTVDSYFWEARRLLGAEKDPSPRRAFIRAVAGQSPRGYERAVLERGELPEEFVAELENIHGDRERRRTAVETLMAATTNGIPSLFNAVPVLAPGVRVVPKPVMGDGEFRWGHVLTTPDRPEGTECSPLVSAMVSGIASGATVKTLLDGLTGQFSRLPPEKLQQDLLTTLSILYTEGAIESLKIF